MHSIVIVEDELIAAHYLKEVLQDQGFEVLAIIDKGAEAIAKIPALEPDLVLMDIMLKDHISGSEVALALRQKSPKSAIVFLTAYADSEMVEYAISSNCYGYLMKPYNESVIINTLKVVQARISESGSMAAQEVQTVRLMKNYLFDKEKRRLLKEGVEVRLSPKAIAFIELLCQQPNISVSNEQISQYVWGEAKNAITLRTQVFRIRAHIGTGIIENVNGLGYMIKTEQS